MFDIQHQKLSLWRQWVHQFCQLEPPSSVGMGVQAGKYCNLRTNLSTRGCFPSPLAWAFAISPSYRVISILGFYTCWTLIARRSLWPGRSRRSCGPHSVASRNTRDSRDARWPWWARGTRGAWGPRHRLFSPCVDKKKNGWQRDKNNQTKKPQVNPLTVESVLFIQPEFGNFASGGFTSCVQTERPRGRNDVPDGLNHLNLVIHPEDEEWNLKDISRKW